VPHGAQQTGWSGGDNLAIGGKKCRGTFDRETEAKTGGDGPIYLEGKYTETCTKGKRKSRESVGLQKNALSQHGSGCGQRDIFWGQRKSRTSAGRGEKARKKSKKHIKDGIHKKGGDSLKAGSGNMRNNEWGRGGAGGCSGSQMGSKKKSKGLLQKKRLKDSHEKRKGYVEGYAGVRNFVEGKTQPLRWNKKRGGKGKDWNFKN